jgi:hypothetical protein
VDRAHHVDHNHNHNVDSSESAAQSQSHHSPLRPNSTSHLGRRIHHQNLAPKKPIGASRQDSATPESPSPKAPSESSPESAHDFLSKNTTFLSRPSPVVNPHVPSRVLDSSVGPVPSGRAAIHTLTHPHSIIDTSDQHNDQPPSKLASSTRRKARPSHPRELSISAPTASSLPKPAARIRRRAASSRAIEQPNLRTTANGQHPSSNAHVMPPPSLSRRNGSNAVASGPSTNREMSTSRSSPPNSDSQRTLPLVPESSQGSNANLPAPVMSNGQVIQTTNAESLSDAPSLRTNTSPSPTDADPPSPDGDVDANRVLRCRICNLVYEPLSMQRAHEEWRTTPGQSQATLSDMIRDFPEVQKSHYSNWIEQHQHDPTLHKNHLLVRQGLSNPHNGTFHSNKRKRPVEEDQPPNIRPTHYPTKDSSYDFSNS